MLLAQIEKWTKRIASEMENAEGACPKGREMLANIRAYIADCAHFREEGDLVRSFEAIVWAWAWLEIGIDIKYIEKQYVDIRKVRD